MIRFIHILVVIICLSVTSCRNGVSVIYDEKSAVLPVTVSFPDVCFTKSSDLTTLEAAVSDVKLVVYRMVNGVPVVDTHYDFANASSGTVYVYPERPAEAYVFAAYANHSGLDFIAPEKDWSCFKDEELGHFTMFGTITKTLDELHLDPSVVIDLYRQICKVSIKKISLNWRNESNYHKEFRVKAVYLTDVPGMMAMMHDIPKSEVVSWWNTNGYVAGEQDDLLFRSITDGLVLKDVSYESSSAVYGYVSSIQRFNDSSVWTEGGTRLVIEAQHGAETVYYPIPICFAKEDRVCNKHFVFEEIIITRPGASEPYGIYPEEDAISVVCSVQEWNVINRGSIVIS